jgi:hypothetical protein
LIKAEGLDCQLARAVGRDWKGKLSLRIYAAAIALALVLPFISCALYVVVAVVWLAPDPRIERTIAPPQKAFAGG